VEKTPNRTGCSCRWYEQLICCLGWVGSASSGNKKNSHKIPIFQFFFPSGQKNLNGLGQTISGSKPLTYCNSKVRSDRVRLRAISRQNQMGQQRMVSQGGWMNQSIYNRDGPGADPSILLTRKNKRLTHL